LYIIANDTKEDVVRGRGERVNGATPGGAEDTRDAVVVVSSDTHIGPLLKEQLRDYCPAAFLGRFDAFARREDEIRGLKTMPDRSPNDSQSERARYERNLQTDGHYDRDARLRDLDYDGVAAEVIFHGSQNLEPIPFNSLLEPPPFGEVDFGLRAVGNQIYNRWLGEYCSVQPERHVGLAHLSMWDPAAATAEVEVAREMGLRSVNFPAPQRGLAEYDDPVWEPFWSACEAADMPLTTHSGAGDPASWTGPQQTSLLMLESGGWASRRGLIRMLFGGVFERHPSLKLVLTEQPGEWWPLTMIEMDSAYRAQHRRLRDQMPRMPSEYCHSNVFVGASFLSNSEARGAVRDGYASQLLWGSDYPHTEGTYQYPEDGAFEREESMTHLALRFALDGISPEASRQIVGGNAIRAYGLDEAALALVAARINAPTLTELATPLESIPEHGGMMSFRQMGPWA
jgi:predicted TIM-barrel fold metal-dependent hydrolase